MQDNKQQAGLLNAASTMIASVLVKVENVAGQEQAVKINLHDISSPPLWQWLLPLMLATLLYILSY
jgi:hypothetical protein